MAEITYKDRVKGMFAAFSLGDALGAPHEFYQWNRNRIYTGKLELEPFRMIDPRFAKGADREKRQPIGTVTDDTQMTIALLKVILKNGKYNRDDAILLYAAWVHSKPADVGKNTRYVFANKTIKGYDLRMKKLNEEIAAGTRKVSLANGALMRCSPIALLDENDWLKAAIADVKLSNPYRQTVEVNIIYLQVLRMLLEGTDLVTVKDFIYELKPKSTSVKRVITDLITNADRDISGRDKGLAVHALWVSLRGLLMDKSYAKTIRWVITQGKGNTGQGDTDTNAAITGALLGSRFGYKKIMKNKVNSDNWQILIGAAQNVREEMKPYVPHNFDTLIRRIFDVL